MRKPRKEPLRWTPLRGSCRWEAYAQKASTEDKGGTDPESLAKELFQGPSSGKKQGGRGELQEVKNTIPEQKGTRKHKKKRPRRVRRPGKKG